MVKDEYVRTIRGESTRFDGGEGDAPKKASKNKPKASPKPPFGDGSSTASPSSPSGIRTSQPEDDSSNPFDKP
jgi:hypothetical protein